MTPLFVVGAPRSGTTLTRTLLQGFEPVYLPPDEFQILPRFAALAEEEGRAEALAQLVEGSVFAGHMRRRGIWPGQAEVARTLQETASQGAASAFHALVLAIAAKDGHPAPQYWGDKTPETVFQLELVKRLWPDARILEVVRDPRATVLSMRRSWGRSLLRGSVIWRDALAATQAFTAAHGPDSLHRVTFEALTEDPGGEMDRIGAWLGLAYDHGTLEAVSSEERWGAASGTKGVQKRTAKDWLGAFSQKELLLIEEICFEPMQAAGYAPQLAHGSRAPGRTALRLARAGDGLRVLRAYARERGWPAALRYKLSQWRSATGA